MIKTTRQQILDLLDVKQIATAREICQILHISHANARRHLNILEDEGLIQVTGLQKNLHGGRPARLYQLSFARQEHNLEQLASTLLKMVLSRFEPEEWRLILTVVAKEIAVHPEPEVAIQSLTHKLNDSVNLLNQLHYKSRWEAHTDNPLLILGHCPYRQIVDNHPELCQMDATLIEQLTGETVIQTAKLEKTPLGLEACIFQVRKK